MTGKASLNEKGCGWMISVSTPNAAGEPTSAVYYVAITDQNDAVAALKAAIKIPEGSKVSPTQKLAAKELKVLRLKLGEVKAR
jgi:hypothetical protein